MRAGLEPALGDAVDDALHQIGRGRQALGFQEALGPLVEPDQIGKSSANIDGNDDHALTPLTHDRLVEFFKAWRRGH